MYYPGYHGTFLAFAESDDSRPVLCNCAESPVKNYLRLREREGSGDYGELVWRTGNPRHTVALPSPTFPMKIVERCLETEMPPLELVEFEPALCHRCNEAIPTLRYCHESNGGKFEQRHGWYINQTFYRLGLSKEGHYVLRDVCPDELLKLVDRFHESRDAVREQADLVGSYKPASRPQNWPGDSTVGDDPEKLKPLDSDELRQRIAEIHKELRTLQKKSNKLRRDVRRAVENITRNEFGHHEVGSGWVSETTVYQIVDEIFEESEVLRHHRPDWLEGLELDVFVPEYQLGIEYQGEQHFEPVEAWGGEKALRKQEKRDERTRKLCEEHGVELIEITYEEPTTLQHIRQEISSALSCSIQ